MKLFFACFLSLLLSVFLFSCDNSNNASITQTEVPEETIHTHTYIDGVCVDCGGFDDSYFSTIYNDLTYKMSHMETYVDVIELEKLIDLLPDSYRNVSTISSEYKKIYSLFKQMQEQHIESISNAFRDEDEKVIVDYNLIKSCFSDLLSLERHLDCNWSIKPPLQNYFNDGLCTWACAFFKGYYSTTDDIYLAFMESKNNGLLLKTNIPCNKTSDKQYTWTIEYGDIYYIPEGSDSRILAFKIQDFTENTLKIYCYKNTTVYTLYYHPVETDCNHFFDNGSYCLYCNYYPETVAPETEAPETEAPETEAPETEAPETEAPETEAPETEAPESVAPESVAPDVIIKISNCGDLLSIGKLVDGLFLSCSDENLSGKAALVLPIYYNKHIVGIDSFKSFYIKAIGSVTYNYSGKIESIGSIYISYNFDGTISRIGTTSISYNFDDTISRIGTTSISYNFDGTISRIGTTSISYNFDDTISRIGDIKIYYNFDGTVKSIGNI